MTNYLIVVLFYNRDFSLIVPCGFYAAETKNVVYRTEHYLKWENNDILSHFCLNKDLNDKIVNQECHFCKMEWWHIQSL